MSIQKDKPLTEISVTPVCQIPDDSFDMINRFGTYEIQATADTPNEYPAISQGLARKEHAIRENQKT